MKKASDWTDEQHPSYGCIQISRVSGTTRLFRSNLDKHVETCVCCGTEGDLEPFAQGPLCPACKVKVREQLKHKEAWRAYWMAVLDLWAHAAEAGYPSAEVKAFTFRPEFLDKREKRRYDLRRETGTTRFNCVRLHTGELKPMPLIERPQKPDGNDPSDDHEAEG